MLARAPDQGIDLLSVLLYPSYIRLYVTYFNKNNFFHMCIWVMNIFGSRMQHYRFGYLRPPSI